MINNWLKSAAQHFQTMPALPAHYPDWAKILNGADASRWQAALARAKKGPKILLANSAGMDAPVSIVDSLLAVALTLRGADVHILLCDQALPACWMSLQDLVAPAEFARIGPSEKLCGGCFSTGYELFHSLGLPVHRYSEFISAEEAQKAAALSSAIPFEEIAAYRFGNVAVGEHARCGALRYFARGSLEHDRLSEEILRRFFAGALLAAQVAERLLRSVAFSRVAAVHGIYVPEGVIGEVARREGIPFAAWATGYRKHCLIFSHHDSYHYTMLSEPTEYWENIPWTDDLETDIVDYLKSRWYGTRDWIGYVVDPLEDTSSIATQLGVDFSRPCVGLLTNVVWDGQVHYRANAFSSMIEWTIETIKYFANRPDLQLIVRIHPAEIRQVPTSKQLMSDEIKRVFPELPRNVFIIPPESSISTYATMLKCNAVLIYGTKTGVELASAGVPVVVAGDAWIRNKGLTHEASSAAEYFAILDRLPFKERMSEAAIRRARKYAYHFFCRRMIPVPILEPSTGAAPFELKITGIDELLPGRCPGLDVICDGLIKGEEFIYPAERYPTSVAETGKFSARIEPRRSSEAAHRPIVSVVIPTRNRAASLREALDSVYGQHGLGSEFDADVIVVDDASSDDTPDVVKAYPEAHYIRLDTNSGPSAARNAGIEISNGEYVCFLDDDDFWLPQRVISHLPVLENYPGFSAVYGQWVRTGMGKEAVYPDAGLAPGGMVFESLLKEDLVYPSSLMVRRHAFDKAGFYDEGLRCMGHYDMALRLAFHGAFAFVAGPVAIGRAASDGLGMQGLREGDYQREVALIIDKTVALLPNGQETAALRRQAISQWISRVARRLDENGQVDLLRAHLIFSLKKYPWIVDETAVHDLFLSAATKIAFEQHPASMVTAARQLCQEIKAQRNGYRNGNMTAVRQLLGDILTTTAIRLWDSGNLKAAGRAASYAVVEDPSQVARQARGISRRLIRLLLATPKHVEA